MTDNPLNTFGTVKLDGSGNGTVRIGPSVRGQVWTLTVAAVVTSTAGVPTAAVPQCTVFIGAQPTNDNLIDGTFTGSLNATGAVAGHPITAGNYIYAVWSGGDPNSTATLSIFGTYSEPSR